MARGYDVGRPESRVECEVPPARRKHPPSDHHPPPTPKMGLEERSPSPRPSPPGEGEARTVLGIFTPFGVELLHGDSRRLLRGPFKPHRLTIPSCRPFCSPPFSFASVWPLPIKRVSPGVISRQEGARVFDLLSRRTNSKPNANSSLCPARLVCSCSGVQTQWGVLTWFPAPVCAPQPSAIRPSEIRSSILQP